MSDECLATGFANVDDSADKRFYPHCLSLIDSLPYCKQCKGRYPIPSWRFGQRSVHS